MTRRPCNLTIKRQRARIRRRDGDLCCWCHQRMFFEDRSVAVNHPNRVTLEHIIPLSEGGSAGDDNCALAHLRCNLARNERPASEPTSASAAAELRRIAALFQGRAIAAVMGFAPTATILDTETRKDRTGAQGSEIA